MSKENKEIEIKIPLSFYQVEKLRRKLNDLGATLVDKVIENDFYIDLKPCIDVISRDIALRIRYVKSFMKGGERCELTYKGPRESKKFKVRKEISVIVNDCESLLRIFSELEFNYINISKVREVYYLNDIKIYVDNVKDLGTFMEVELMNVTLKEFEKRLNNILKLLNIDKKKYITKSYLELLLEGNYREAP